MKLILEVWVTEKMQIVRRRGRDLKAVMHLQEIPKSPKFPWEFSLPNLCPYTEKNFLKENLKEKGLGPRTFLKIHTFTSQLLNADCLKHIYPTRDWENLASRRKKNWFLFRIFMSLSPTNHSLEDVGIHTGQFLKTWTV